MIRPWTEMRSRWVDWINLLLGIWLFISPWVLGLATRRAASPGNFWWVGGAIFFFALWALTAPWARWTEWINIILAVWLFISPWVLGFAQVPRAAWNAWIVAVIVFLLACAGLAVARRLTLRPPLGQSQRPMRGPLERNP